MDSTPKPSQPVTGLNSNQWLKIWEDISCTLKQPRLWIGLGWRDVRVQFERSFLGPFWMTLQAMAWIGAIVFVFAGIMGPPREYAVYVAIGIVLYNFITTIITDSSEVFIRNRIIIHSHPNPYFSYILRQVVYALIQLAFQSLTVIAVLVIAQYPLSYTAILAIPGLLLGVIMSISLALTFGLLGLRHGDFRFLMLAVMRLGLFVTPILWTLEGGGHLKQLAAIGNPLAHFINIVRMPLMGEMPSMLSYGVAIGCILFVTGLSLLLFFKTRRSIPMWL